MVLAQIMVVKIYNPLSVSRNPNRPLLLKLACSRSVLFSPTSLHPLIIFGLQESEEYWGVSPQPSGSFRPKCHRCYHACSWLLSGNWFGLLCLTLSITLWYHRYLADVTSYQPSIRLHGLAQLKHTGPRWYPSGLHFFMILKEHHGLSRTFWELDHHRFLTDHLSLRGKKSPVLFQII